MKRSSLVLAGMLVAALVVMAAPSAKADGIPDDPHIIMNGGNDPSTCTADICFDQTAANQDTPVVLDFFNSTQTFEYLPTGSSSNTDLADIFFLLTGPAIKPGIYTCSGNVFTSDCFGVFEDATVSTEYPGSLELFALVDITPGESGTLEVTPEPGTFLLLGVGLIALVGFRRKLGSLAA
jgi:hypothetical protein